MSSLKYTVYYKWLQMALQGHSILWKTAKLPYDFGIRKHENPRSPRSPRFRQFENWMPLNGSDRDMDFVPEIWYNTFQYNYVSKIE